MFPGVVAAPFSVVKLGPDVSSGTTDAYSGYLADGKIFGFSMLHESGTGGAPKVSILTVLSLTAVHSIQLLTDEIAVWCGFADACDWLRRKSPSRPITISDQRRSGQSRILQILIGKRYHSRVGGHKPCWDVFIHLPGGAGRRRCGCRCIPCATFLSRFWVGTELSRRELHDRRGRPL